MAALWPSVKCARPPHPPSGLAPGKAGIVELWNCVPWSQHSLRESLTNPFPSLEILFLYTLCLLFLHWSGFRVLDFIFLIYFFFIGVWGFFSILLKQEYHHIINPYFISKMKLLMAKETRIISIFHGGGGEKTICSANQEGKAEQLFGMVPGCLKTFFFTVSTIDPLACLFFGRNFLPFWVHFLSPSRYLPRTAREKLF